MQKIIKEVDQKRGIVQITTSDERWYLKSGKDTITGLPTYSPVPSVTWVAGHWPKGIAFYKWLADKGWDEAEAVKNAAGDKGSKVHLAIEMILNGEEFLINTKVLNKSTGDLEELSYEELLCVKSFCDWRDEVKPEVIATEITIMSEVHGYAGTVDLVCKIDGQLYVVDFKTSKQVWREHEMQISAYRVALENGENPIAEKNPNGTETGKMVDISNMRMAILQVGYNRNKAGFKFTEIEDQFPNFKVAYQIWKAEIGSNTPGFTQKDFPIVLSKGKEKRLEEVQTVGEVIKKRGRPAKSNKFTAKN